MSRKKTDSLLHNGIFPQQEFQYYLYFVNRPTTRTIRRVRYTRVIRASGLFLGPPSTSHFIWNAVHVIGETATRMSHNWHPVYHVVGCRKNLETIWRQKCWSLVKGAEKCSWKTGRRHKHVATRVLLLLPPPDAAKLLQTLAHWEEDRLSVLFGIIYSQVKDRILYTRNQI